MWPIVVWYLHEINNHSLLDDGDHLLLEAGGDGGRRLDVAQGGVEMGEQLEAVPLVRVEELVDAALELVAVVRPRSELVVELLDEDGLEPLLVLVRRSIALGQLETVAEEAAAHRPGVPGPELLRVKVDARLLEVAVVALHLYLGSTRLRRRGRGRGRRPAAATLREAALPPRRRCVLAATRRHLDPSRIDRVASILASACLVRIGSDIVIAGGGVLEHGVEDDFEGIDREDEVTSISLDDSNVDAERIAAAPEEGPCFVLLAYPEALAKEELVDLEERKANAQLLLDELGEHFLLAEQHIGEIVATAPIVVEVEGEIEIVQLALVAEREDARGTAAGQSNALWPHDELEQPKLLFQLCEEGLDGAADLDFAVVSMRRARLGGDLSWPLQQFLQISPCARPQLPSMTILVGSRALGALVEKVVLGVSAEVEEAAAAVPARWK